MNVRAQSFFYLLATIVLVLVVGWVGGITWQELRQLHRSFASMQTDDFHLSGHIEASIRDLNETVQRFDLRGNPGDRLAFREGSRVLEEWILEHENADTTSRPSELMRQIKSELLNYLSVSTHLMDERAKAGAGPSTGSMPILERVETNAAPILELCRQLKAAERDAHTVFMKDSRRALAWVQQLLIAVLVVLVALMMTAVLAVYRGIIGPLRVALFKSRALAARNEKLASLGTLAAGVAHEIRNPLTAINVRLHSLKRNLVPHSSEAEDALIIGHEIQRLERLLKEFLEFARPAEPKRMTVSADSLLARVQTLLGSQLEKNSIRLKLESVPDIWVRADPHQIEQVLINLIQNAADSIERDGTITLRVRTGKARLGRTRPAVILEVSDTGKGILPEVQKRMFDPFFTTKEEGTGLGLVIALRIVEKHGGTLECRSEPNRGSTFSILLPHTKPEEESHEPSSQDSVN